MSAVRLSAATSLIAAAMAIAVPAMAQDAMISAAKPGEVRILASTGVREVMQELKPQLEKAAGHPVVIQFGASSALQGVIESDQAFEVAVVTPAVLDAGIVKGKLRAGSRQDLARVMVEIGQRGGTGRQDIRTADGLKAALAGAKVVHFNPQGSGRPTVDKTLATLGIESAAFFRDKVKPLPAATAPAAPLAVGEYELTIVLASEMASLAPGSVDLGPFPALVQVPVVMSAGSGAGGDSVAAQAVIAVLKAPATTTLLNAHHMTRP